MTKHRLTNLLLLIPILVLGSNTAALAQPCYSNFTYRLPFYLDNTQNAEEKNLQLVVSLNTSTLVSAGKMSSTGNDVRVLDRKGNPLSFYIEEGTINTASTKIWVKTDSILAYAMDTIYLFYGNSSASNISNKTATFNVFDDFSGSSLGSGWSQCGTGSATLSGGKLTLSSSTGTRKIITTVASFTAPLLIEVGVSSSSGGKNFIAGISTSGAGYGLTHNSGFTIDKVVSSSNCYTLTALNSSNTNGTVSGNWSFVWNNSNTQNGVWPGASSTTSDNTTIATLDQKIVIGNDNGGSFEIDWIRARKYSSNNISITSGSEVSTSYTITPSYNSPLCEGSDLKLTVNQVAGATYLWTGPVGSGFSSTQREPIINGVKPSDAGQYTVEVRIPTGCASQNKTVNVSITAKSKGGTLQGSQTVCGGSNTGSLTLTGQVGNITGWDTTTNLNGTWTNVSSTSNSRSYTDLATSAYFRVIVKNGTCSSDTSTIGIINVTPASKGGTILGSDSVCEGSNSGILSVSGHIGNIERWESSTNGFLWNSINNRSTTQNFSNLTTTTFYRAIAKNGLCNEATSDVKTIIVDKVSLGGSIAGVAQACEGLNAGVLRLSGQRGKIVGWESSTTGASPWNSISNTVDSFTFSNINQTTYYRALVKNGLCNIAPSSAQAVSIIAASKGGIISGGTTVCETANSGTLTASNYLGTIQKWQYKRLGSGTWSDITNNNSSLSWGSLSDSTDYRVLVSNQGCPVDSSQIGTINVNKATQSGYLTGDNNVCAGSNSGKLTLNGFLGNVVNWERSNSGFAPWTALSNQTIEQSFQNISTDVYYRVVLKNGVCSQVNTSAFRVKVDQVSKGGITGNNLAVCGGSNFGLIGLGNQVGDIIRWEQTEDTTSGNWNSISNFTNRQDFRDLVTSTFYRAVVKNGVCVESNSSITSISVSNPTEAGNLKGDTTFCTSINQGTLTLENQEGDVLRWESSLNGLNPWTAIPNTSNTLSFQNLSATTFYRAVVKSGVCSQVTTPISVIDVFPASSGGTISSSDTNLCTGANFGTLSLENYNGNISHWEMTEDKGNSWKRINNLTSQHFFYNLTNSRSFRAVVQNGLCAADTSNALEIVVSSNPIGGKIEELIESCQGAGSGAFHLENYFGNVNKWQTSSTTNGPWADINTQVDSITYINPTITTYYRAVVSSGTCGSTSSNIGLLKVYEPTKTGTLLGGGEVCDSSNSGLVTIDAQVGSVIDWETADNILGPWTSTGIQSNNYSYFNLNQPLSLRAIIRNGVCPNAITAPVSFTINPKPVVDFTTGSLCDGRPVSFSDVSTISSGSINDYFWAISDGYTSSQSSFSKTFLNPGVFQVSLQVRSDKGCTQTINKSVSVSQSPQANFKFVGDLGNGIICNADSLGFSNLSLASNAGSLVNTWDFGDGTTSNLENPIKIYSNPGVYEVKLNIQNSAGCKDSIQRYVTVYKTVKPFAGKDELISKGIPYRLNSSGGILYNWKPASYLNNPLAANPIATIDSTTTFILETVDNNGCVSRDTVTLTVKEDYRLRPNNVITPDGNNENDFWIIDNIKNYPNNQVAVFDRWGREIFSAKSYKNDWGATDKEGNTLMDGTYYYVISFDDSDLVYKGAITVVNNK